MPHDNNERNNNTSRRVVLGGVGAGFIINPLLHQELSEPSSWNETQNPQSDPMTNNQQSGGEEIFSDDFNDGQLDWTDVDHPEFWSEENGQVLYTPSTSAGSRGDNALYADETVDDDQGTLRWPFSLEFEGGATDTSAGVGALAVSGGPKDWGPTRNNVRLGLADTAYNDQITVWNSEGDSFEVGSSRENRQWYRYQLIPDLEENVIHVHRDDESWTVPEPRTEPLENIAIVLNGGTCWGCGGPGRRRYRSIRAQSVQTGALPPDPDYEHAYNVEFTPIAASPTQACVEVSIEGTGNDAAPPGLQEVGPLHIGVENLTINEEGRIAGPGIKLAKMVPVPKEEDGNVELALSAGRIALSVASLGTSSAAIEAVDATVTIAEEMMKLNEQHPDDGVSGAMFGSNDRFAVGDAYVGEATYLFLLETVDADETVENWSLNASYEARPHGPVGSTQQDIRGFSPNGISMPTEDF